MKLIPLGRHGIIDAKLLLTELVKSSPAGQTVQQMRDRLKVLKKLEAAGPDGVVLEDSEHATLRAILNSRNDFIMTSEDILAVIDGVESAKEPPPPAPPAPIEPAAEPMPAAPIDPGSQPATA